MGDFEQNPEEKDKPKDLLPFAIEEGTKKRWCSCSYE